jgi:catechol 2,3-dioxygenase-like lactoylglutathione lyase family enzyme
MNPTLVREMKSVVLTSDAPDTTAAFYRDILGLPLETEQHRGTVRHWACQLGSIHFAIHDRKGFWLEWAPVEGPPPTVVSFTIVDLDAFLDHLRAQGAPVVARNRIGPMEFVALRDPDGRTVCCGTPWPGT